jgi:hypothetical protein
MQNAKVIIVTRTKASVQPGHKHRRLPVTTRLNARRTTIAPMVIRAIYKRNNALMTKMSARLTAIVKVENVIWTHSLVLHHRLPLP